LSVFLPHLPAAGAGDGLHQLGTDPELEQLVADQHVAALPGPMFAHTDLLPADADDPVAAHLAGDPAVAFSIRGACRLDHRPGRRHGIRRTRPRLVDRSAGVEPLSRGRIIEGLVRPGGVVVADPLIQRLLRHPQRGKVRRVSNSARRVRWNRSILPVVVGDRGWVNKCSMPFSRQIRSNNTSVGGVKNFPVNTRPLSVKICCGTP
jgi:hypothetical protein